MSRPPAIRLLPRPFQRGPCPPFYLRDPDQNGVELYRDQPQSERPRTPAGKLAMFTRLRDLEALLREAPPPDTNP